MTQDKEELMAAIAREKQALKDELIATLAREIQELNDRQDQKILHLRKEHKQDLSLIRMVMITIVKIPCEQTMTNFEDWKSSNNPWYSRPFTTPSRAQNYKFCLVVFANGSGSNEGTHVSIYADLMEGPAAGGEIAVTLINQLGDHGGIRVNIPLSCEVPNPFQRRPPGVNLISHQELQNRTENIAYLQNDQLRLRITNFRVPTRQGWFWS